MWLQVKSNINGKPVSLWCADDSVTIEEVSSASNADASVAGSEGERGQMRQQLLSLYHEMERFRFDPVFHSKGVAKTGKGAWLAEVKNIGHRAAANDSLLNYTRDAANYLETLAMEYLRSKGEETDSSRQTREFLAERLEAPEVFTVRRAGDFAFIHDGKRPLLISNITIAKLTDMIAAAMGDRISWLVAESGLFKGEAVDGKLVRYDAEHLFYASDRSSGTHIEFALKRSDANEKEIAEKFGDAARLYDSIIRGENQGSDPLRADCVLVTSGTVLNEKARTEMLVVRVIRLTEG